MKKILLFIPILFFAFSSCDQMDEVYEDLDVIKLEYSNSIEFLFTDDDYATASDYAVMDAVTSADSTYALDIKNAKAFNTFFTAEDYVGKVLGDLYPEYNKTSNALVTYNVETGTPEWHLDYIDADSYYLDEDDYTSVGGYTEIKGYFVPSTNPEDYLPGILESNNTSPVEGDIVMANYNYYDVEPTDSLSSFALYSEDFSDYSNYDSLGLNDVWIQVEEVGTREWLAREYSGNAYAQYSSYGSGEANVAWLVSPKIDLSVGINNKLSFDVNIGYYTHTGLEVFISEDFDGSDVTTATWDDVTSSFTIPTEPTGGYGSFASAGLMDLSAYSGEIHIAFKYTGDGNNSETTTYQVDNILVLSGLPDPSDKYNVYYEYTGTEWEVSEGATAVNRFEYDAMGSPGNYGNFSSSDAPEDYLPQLLASKYPYAQEGDEINVSYKYYDGGTVTMIDNYKFELGVWMPISTIIETTNQFIHNGELWLFDPTITYVLSGDDYQIIVDWVIANKDVAYIGYDSRRESYFGVNAKYSSYSIYDGGYEGDDFATWQDAVKESFSQTNLLPQIFPDATVQVNGVDMYYNVVIGAYDGPTTPYSVRYQVTKSGPSPEFEYIEGPTEL